MSLMFIRVLAGFLAGMAAGILMMRIAYKKQGMIKPEDNNTQDAFTSTTSH